MPSYEFREQTFQFERYPVTNNRSLKPLSAADELLIDRLSAQAASCHDLLLQHDRFGVLARVFAASQPQFVSTFASQQKALERNFAANGNNELPKCIGPLDLPGKTMMGAMKIPKSLQLFELYLAQFAWMVNTSGIGKDAKLFAGFMTRHFTPNLLKIAERYANVTNQSRAVKKARILELSEFKKDVPAPADLILSIRFHKQVYQQYYGVFSAGQIDYATQFLVDFLRSSELVLPSSFQFLDMACGNGVLANEVASIYPQAKGFAIDDFSLATSSAMMNVNTDQVQVILDDGLDKIPLDSLDLVVCNPPFHFGYETNIEVSLGLFKQACRALRSDGQLLIVANRHLNYRTHLIGLFYEVETVKQDDKFEILLAKQPRELS